METLSKNYCKKQPFRLKSVLVNFIGILLQSSKLFTLLKMCQNGHTFVFSVQLLLLQLILNKI